MGVTSSESVQRIQKILETLEEKKLAHEASLSYLNRTKIEVGETLKAAHGQLEHAKRALEQTRQHLEAELVKLDPTLFVDRRDVSKND